MHPVLAEQEACFRSRNFSSTFWGDVVLITTIGDHLRAQLLRSPFPFCIRRHDVWTHDVIPHKQARNPPWMQVYL